MIQEVYRCVMCNRDFPDGESLLKHVDCYRGADAADAPDRCLPQMIKRRDYRDVLRERGQVLPLEDIEPPPPEPTEEPGS